MCASIQATRPTALARPWGKVCLLGLLVSVLTATGVAQDGRARKGAKPTREQLAQGRELFMREWLSGDRRSHEGDGLGPVFNDSSCVACHNGGAPGGGGPNSKNVDILTAAPSGMQMNAAMQATARPRFFDLALESLLGVEPPKVPANVPVPPKPARPDRGPLIALHPGFRTANSIVVHRFATEPEYDQWRFSALGAGAMFGFNVSGAPGDADSALNLQRTMAQFEANQAQFQFQVPVGSFFLLRSQRNPTALFGAGLIDSIPDSVLIEQAKTRFPDYPEVAGRVSRTKDKQIGRFGWKAQTASLEDFVLTACAVELGLEVPGHPQGGLPSKPGEKAKGLDLTADECAALTAYVSNLPKPAESNADDSDIRAGRALFAGSGCAACHVPKLGDVEGIYSDLLLHDMGQDLGDTGQHGVFVPDSSELEIPEEESVGGVAQTTAVPVEGQVEVGAAADVQIGPEPPPAMPVATLVDGPIAQRVFPAGTVSVGPNGIAPTRPKDGPASRQEWRTPPLWGLRDSGPYLHDGRAATLDRAIALHGGEGTASARKYFGLSLRQRLQVQAFLKSLTAPASDGVAVATR